MELKKYDHFVDIQTAPVIIMPQWKYVYPKEVPIYVHGKANKSLP